MSYGSGCKNGPIEIIKASHQVELFDEDLNKEPYKEIGIQTLKPFKIKSKLNDALNQLSEINEKILLVPETIEIFALLGLEPPSTGHWRGSRASASARRRALLRPARRRARWCPAR